MVRETSNGTLSAPSSIPVAPQPSPRAWWALSAVLAAAFMDYLDVSVVNAAIPTIQRDLAASDAAIQWIAAGYTLPFALGLITGGRLGDLYGPKRVFLSGVAAFTLASVVCGVATSPAMLIVGRLAQGLAAAVMVPQVFTFIQVFATQQRARAFTYYSIVVAVASVAGAPVGGLLIHADLGQMSWRPVFLLNVVFGALALVAGAILIREPSRTAPSRLDLGGFALVGTGLLMVVFPLIEGPALGWPAWTIAALAGALPLLALFAVHERRVVGRGRTPLVDPGLFQHRSFVVGVAATMMFFAGVNSFFFVVFLYLQRGLGLPVLAASLIVVTWPAGIVVSSTLASRWATGHARRLVMAGTLVMTISTIATLQVIDHIAGRLGAWELAPSLLTTGLGMGLVAPVLMNISLATVPAGQAGSASGVLSSTIQLGASIGVAVTGVIFFSLLHASGPHGSADPAAATLPPAIRIHAFTSATATTLWFHVGVYLATFALAISLPTTRRRSLQP